MDSPPLGAGSARLGAVGGLVPSEHSQSGPAVVTWAASGVAPAQLPFAQSTLSKRISNSQCRVWGNRSTASALTGRNEAPLTLLEGARQRLDGKERGGRTVWMFRYAVHHCCSSKKGFSPPSLNSVIGLFITPNISIATCLLLSAAPCLLCSSCQLLLAQRKPQWMWLKNAVTVPLPKKHVFSSYHIYLVNLMQEILTPQSYSLQLWDCRIHRSASSDAQLF